MFRQNNSTLFIIHFFTNIRNPTILFLSFFFLVLSHKRNVASHNGSHKSCYVLNCRWSPLLCSTKETDLVWSLLTHTVPCMEWEWGKVYLTESLCYMHLVFARLQLQRQSNSKDQLKVRLIQSITHNRQQIVQQKETQSLINVLVSKIPICQKEFSELSKRSVYQIWFLF